MSKVHAQLDLAGGAWTLTDLGSTNGIVVVEPEGTERLLEKGASVVLEGPFQLGHVEMRVELG
jgi:pSer/pThr/pTyr-binding forkhead associated (FHA) protein